jgi:hypothetical protein
LPAILILSLLAVPLGVAAGAYALWPIAIAFLLGVHITQGVAFLLILCPFALAAILVIFFPRQGDAFFDALGKI